AREIETARGGKWRARSVLNIGAGASGTHWRGVPRQPDRPRIRWNRWEPSPLLRMVYAGNRPRIFIATVALAIAVGCACLLAYLLTPHAEQTVQGSAES